MSYFRKISACIISLVLCVNTIFAIAQDGGPNLIEREKFPDIFTDNLPPEQTDDIFDFELDIQDTPEDWDTTRRAIETNTLQEDVTSTETTPQTIYKSEPQKPKPSVNLPTYGTSLSVTGRKIIGFEHTSRRYLSDQLNNVRPQSSSSFNMTQEMQLKMTGKIGPKITVNVDYDDTEEDRKDISIVYKGDEDEIVQGAAFGDIDLSLPPTEFVSYNKQLFGIRMDLKYGGAKATIIGSRTKGAGKTKKFVGNSLFQAKDILDIGYIRRQYYDLTFENPARLPKENSEEVYLNDQSQSVPVGTVITSKQYDDIDFATSQGTGNFRLLKRGIDYNLDYDKGVISFTRRLNEQDVVIIDFEIQNSGGIRLKDNSSSAFIDSGGTGKLKLIKTNGDKPIADELEMGYRRELKLYYSLGQTQIVQDDGLGNFLLKVQDANRKDVDPSIEPVPVYPDDIKVDFERGIFYLEVPFGGLVTPDKDIYASTPISKYVFRAEFISRVKTYFLEPDIVLGSDHVTLDGITMERNKDYFIDYDSGFITFYNPSLISQTSEILVSYDTSSFDGFGTSALLGGRFAYDLGKHFSAGSTVLYETGSQSKTAPLVTNMPQSTLVAEADAKIKDLYILPGVKANFEAEVAQSRTNPNSYGFAVVENMEGVKEEDFASTEHLDWRISSNPSGIVSDPSAINWYTQEVNALDINPNAQADEHDKERVLVIEYDFTKPTSANPADPLELSLVFPYRMSGIDFTRKDNIEMVVYADTDTGLNEGPLVNLHFGTVVEDSDNSGGEDIVCNGILIPNAPKTEDKNCDGILSGEEDGKIAEDNGGWLYDVNGLGTITQRIGQGNGILDTQDLNNNGVLDLADTTGGDFGYGGSLFEDLNDNVQTDQLNFEGWHTLKSPVVINPGEEYNWTSIKQVRITLKKSDAPNAKLKGVIKIAKISAVGNSWQITKEEGGSDLAISGINNEDDPDYEPIFSYGGEAGEVFSDLYGSVEDQKEATGARNIVEQSLELKYSTTGAETVEAQRKFTSSLNLSTHKELRFLLYNNEINPDASFFLRLGTETDFQQIKIDLDDFTGWRLYRLSQVDDNGDNVADRWENESPYDVTITSGGNVNFQGVSLITAGIETTQATQGTVWLNEIHLAEPIIIVGNAHKAGADFEIKGFADFGAKYRYMDRNFHTPITVSTNQDKEEQSAYFNLNVLDWMPVKAQYLREITNTPNPLNTADNNLVTSIEEGIVDKRQASVKTDIAIKKLPKLMLEYFAGETDYELIQRKDDNVGYRAKLEHSFSVLPTKIKAGYGYVTNRTGYDENSQSLPDGLYNLEGTKQDMMLELEFNPLKDFNLLSFYRLEEEKESRNDTAREINYDKSMTQEVNVKGRFKILNWLKPSFDYKINTIENNNLIETEVTKGTQSQTFAIGEIKTINRSALGNINIAINTSEILPDSKLLSSLMIYSNYQLQDGETWQNVESSLDTKPALWIRSSLKPSSPFARRTNLTLRDSINTSQKWKPFVAYDFAGGLAALEGMHISNNITRSVQTSEVTGTETKTISTTLPDLIVTIPDIEKMFGLAEFMSGSTLNLKFARRNTKTVSVEENTEIQYSADIRFKFLRAIDAALNYNATQTDSYDLRINSKVDDTFYENFSAQGAFVYKRLTITPKLNYTYEKTIETGSIVKKEVTTTTPGLMFKLDTNLPRGFTIPLLNKTLKFKNRIIWSADFSYAMKRSPINSIDNSDIFIFSTDADYELNKNLRLKLSSIVERLWHKYLPEEDYISLTFGSSLTLQF